MKTTIKVKVKFLSKEEGGRNQIPLDLLSTKTYRPHFVIEDFDQINKMKKVNEKERDNYFGVLFV